MLKLYTDTNDNLQSAVSFSCHYEINLTYESNVHVNDLDHLDIDTKEFSIIVMRFMAPGEFNGNFDFYLTKRFGEEKFNTIKNNKNIWLMILDVYDETKCITQQLPNTAKEQVNSLSNRTVLINSSMDQSNPYGFFKSKYTIPYWIKLFHVELDNNIWDPSSFVNSHDLKLKSKLMLCLMNNSRMPRFHFYELVSENKEVMDNSLISFVAKGIRLDNDVDKVLTMGSDRYQNSIWYQSTMFSVVFDTTWYKDFFTEKIFKPIINEHPVLAFQHKSYFEYLKTLGFDLMQEPFTDRKYEIADSTMTNETRVMVKDFFNIIKSYNSIKKDKLFKKLYNASIVEIRKENKRKLLSKHYCVNKFNEYASSTIDSILEGYQTE